MCKVFHNRKIHGSWKEHEVAGIVVFSQKLLISYFRLGLVNVKDYPAGLEPPHGLEIGEKLL